MKIKWEDIEFNESEFIEMLKKESFNSEEIPSTLFQGPFSIESILDPMSFSNRHSPIIGHCDFNISERRALAVMKTEGVDFFRVITRYSFIFSAGKAFNVDEVKTRIKSVLGVGIEEQDDMDALIMELAEDGRYCIYVRDGETHSVTEKNKNFDTMVEVYKESHKKFGGRIYEG